jgi:hypothetical protein
MNVNHVITNYTSDDAGRNNIIIIIIIIIIKYSYPARQNTSLWCIFFISVSSGLNIAFQFWCYCYSSSSS